MKVAFIGHRTVGNAQEFCDKLKKEIENLIVNENADEFLFGSKSSFDNLCYKTVTQLKKKHTHILRRYFRAMNEQLDRRHMEFLMSLYESTVFPQMVNGARTASYVVRNEAMIDECDILITYYDENYIPVGRNRYTKSGTELAMKYAEKKGKPIINLFVNNS